MYVTSKEFQLKKTILLAAVIAATAPQAFAQAKNFEGFSLSGNLAVAKTTTDVTFGGATLSDSGTSTNLDVQLQYSFALAPQFVLGVGATIGTGNNKSGTVGGSDISTKDRASFDIVPGYVLSDSTLLYGKVSALSATGVAEGAGGNSSTSLSGIGYGLGVRSMIDKSMFFLVGYDWNRYDEKTINGGAATFKPKADVFSLGFGYKF